MSKRMSRVLALVLTLVMFVSVTTPAFAWGGDIGIGGGWDRDIGDGEIRDLPEDMEPEEGEIYDYFAGEDEEAGFTVTVEAPMGSLPRDAEVRVEAVPVEDVREAVESVLEAEANILVAMDISFWLDGIEIEPEEPVRVKIAAEELVDRTNLTVVHIPDEAEPETVDLVPDEDLTFALSTNEVMFQADSFSVYAVIGDDEPGANARVEVNFIKGTTKVATVYVKNSDELLADGEEPVAGHSYINDIVYDPGVGETLASGQQFNGWSLDVSQVKAYEGQENIPYVGSAYMNDTVGMTIPQIRTFLDTLEIHEGDVLNIYAMVFNVYHVTYEHQGVTVASDVVLMSTNETTADYTITATHDPTSQTEHFDGWKVVDGENNISDAQYNGAAITVGADGVKLYPQGTTMRISGNVKFSTEVSKGNWVVFEENGYGATYNAPMFIKKGEVTQEPPLEMKRSGYTFDGWYTGAPAAEGQDPTGTKYTFGQELTSEDTLTLYAKWIAAETAKYTVIVWQQSVSDDKDATDAQKTYDYAFSVEVEDVDSNTAVSALDLSAYQGLAGNSNYTVRNKTYSFYGFKYNNTMTAKANSGNVSIGGGVVANKDKVDPNGTTVVNLYYDRELVTYNFRVYTYTYTKYTGTSEGYYYIPDGNGGYEEVRLYRNNNTWYRNRSGLGIPYISPYQYSDPYYGDVYTRSSNAAWNIQMTYTGLYQQKLSKYGYDWPTDYRWFTSTDGNSFISIQDIFSSSWNEYSISEFLTNFYGKDFSSNTYVYHYLQNVNGTWPTQANFPVPTAQGNGMVFREFQGFTPSQFRIRLPNGVRIYYTGTSYSGNNLVNPVSHTTSTGWTDWLPQGTGVEYNGNDTWHEIGVYEATSGGIEFRYTRDQFDLTYMVGRFVNRDNEVLRGDLTGTLKTVEDIPFETNLAAYASGGDSYYNPDEATPQTGFVFAGWYEDETCTTPVDFANSTMPMNGKIVYGKWQQIEYRVFLKPNALINGVRDQSLNWGSENQDTNFRIAYNEKVSIPTGTRTNYEFGGWYTDEAFTKPYNKDTRLTDSTVPATPAYDKTVDFTDTAEGGEMDKWGLLPSGTPINKDASRFWITRKLVLYARWSKVLEGAEGIYVQYDATNKGTNAPTDGLLYQEGVNAVAQAASKANADNEQFDYWVLQRWDEASGKFVDVEGTHYYPGQPFPVKEEYAHKVAKTNEDGTPAVNEAGKQLYIYTVQLRAQYVNKDEPKPTYITWYSNIYDAAGNLIPDVQNRTHTTNPSTVEMPYDELAFDAENGYGFTRQNVQINKAIEIPVPYSMDGYTFLGWGRVDKANKDDNSSAAEPSRDASGVTKPEDLDESNLFLKYRNGKWYIKDANSRAADPYTIEVSKIAADEQNPYQDLYAVWGGEFKVYHTGVAGGAIETVQITRATHSYDLTQHLGGAGVNRDGEAPEVLYGGYYLESGLTKPAQVTNGVWPAYDGTNWTFTKAETQNGMEIQPVSGTTYYVKEVPADKYLQPYFHFTYKKAANTGDPEPVVTAWLISDIDDSMYQQTGFVIVNGNNQALVCSSLTVQNKVGGTSVLLKPETIFRAKGVTKGYLSYLEVIADYEPTLLQPGNAVLQYWVTPDGLIVTGIAQRIYTALDTKANVKADGNVAETKVPSKIAAFTASTSEP